MDYEITPEEVKIKLDLGEGFTLLDVREPWEFRNGAHGRGEAVADGRCSIARTSGIGSGRTHCGGLSSRCSLDECDGVAAAAGIRESAVDAWRHRCLVAESRWKGAGVLKQLAISNWQLANTSVAWGLRSDVPEC